MFDLGWQEFMLIALITVVVVGPKDLPRVVRTVSQWVRKARGMARDFHSSIEDVARDAELDEIRRELTRSTEDSIGEIKNAVEDAKTESGIADALDDVKSMADDTKAQAQEMSENMSDEAVEDLDPFIDPAAGQDAPVSEPAIAQAEPEAEAMADSGAEPEKPATTATGAS